MTRPDRAATTDAGASADRGSPSVQEQRLAPEDGTPAAAPATSRHADGGEPRDRPLDRLLRAASGLASTIAVTEELAQQRADLLRERPLVLGASAHRASSMISLADAAARTGRHPEVLRRWCAEGQIPAVRIGRTWAISKETLAELLANNSRARPRFTSGRSRA